MMEAWAENEFLRRYPSTAGSRPNLPPIEWCERCGGEGEYDRPVDQDSFGNWFTVTVECDHCFGDGIAR